MILQTYPPRLYFSSLRTVALSISSYDEFRWIQEHQDYSRLKQRCRQKFLQETVTKTWVVGGSLVLTDLTDDVVIIGDSPVAHGSFSDVWKGTWNDPIERRPRIVRKFSSANMYFTIITWCFQVALKFLRQIMVQNVREKLLKVFHSLLSPLLCRSLAHYSVSKRKLVHGIGFAIGISVSYLVSYNRRIVLPWSRSGVIMVLSAII